MNGKAKPRRTTAATPAGEAHQVLTVEGGRPTFRREVCAECPWRLDAEIGKFPAEAYRISAPTAYDMSPKKFACHMSGNEHTQACAGFLISQGGHNLGVRMSAMKGDIDPSKLRRTVPLHPNYRAMAVANGVDPDDPVLADCRDDARMA